ncbi:MAG: NAD-dependent DNA ligase LigA [Planctomycetes bacterium]|nr:NAD-dependent DNA ligase LigA [Planctomycetota bacterium]
MQNDIKTRLEHLKKNIDEHNYKYHVLSNPVISDEEYDKLFRELLDLEQRYPDLITSDSPTQKVGYKIQTEFSPIKHSKPMLSIESITTQDQIEDWVRMMERFLKTDKLKCSYICEPKIDGLSIELVYTNRVLRHASTRGDGTTGENVTENIKTLKQIPLKLLSDKCPALLEIRGEVYMAISDFNKLNEEQIKKGLQTFANPRNATSGSLRQLDTSITAARNLKFFAHGSGTINGMKFYSDSDLLNFLKAAGLPTATFEVTDNTEGILKYHNKMLADRDKIDFEIDGCVIKVNEVELREQLGIRSRSPRWAIAYKFPAREATTKLNNVKIQVGRTGEITPVAELIPVNIGGAMIKHASLHNFEYVKGLGLKIHDTVVVSRRGDVIPQVEHVIKDTRTHSEKPIEIPSACPSCSSKLTFRGSDKVMICPNKHNCPEQIKGALRHFTSREATNIEYLGTKWIERLFIKGLIKTVADIYKLKDKKDELTNIRGLGTKSIENLLEAIEKSKQQTFSRFINALGILHVGTATAKLLAEQFQTIEELRSASLDKLQSIKGIGEVVAQSIFEFFKDERSDKIIKQLFQSGVTIIYDRSERSRKLSGMVFVLTGTLASITRKEAQQKILENGGETRDQVTKDSTHVLVGENAGSKLEKAKELGKKILNETEFLSMISS